MTEQLASKLATLPVEPGCYLMKDAQDTIIYVGKAKRLRQRVNQYFSNRPHDFKTTKLVSCIVDFDYIITSSEKEALILENNLIKKHRPRFNILMMDDKTYPYLRLTSEKHPRLRVVRDTKDKKAKHFGPFSDSTAAYSVMKLLNRMYPLRKCQHLPHRACLYYHLNQCLAPCIQSVEPATYEDIAKSIEGFLKGDTKEILQQLHTKMEAASLQMEFEQAKEWRDLIASIEHIVDRQKMEGFHRRDMDVFAYVADKNYISIQGLLIRSGKLLERTLKLFELHDEPDEAFQSFLVQYYEHNPMPQDLLLPQDMDVQILEGVLQVKIIQPMKGEKNKLMELVKHNAQRQLEQKFEVAYQSANQNIHAMKELAQSLQVSALHTIEMFDNSHLSGTNKVSGMIRIENGMFDKSQYRKFKLRQEGSDDLSMMKEAIYRRYFRLLREGKTMPDLIIMDGGLLQMEACKEILASLELNIPVCGLIKDDKHRTSKLLDMQGDAVTILHDSALFYFLTRLQDEVHRFAITFHQQLRSKSMKTSILDDIQGIGEVRKKALMRHFKSIKRMQAASLEELEAVLPKQAALAVFNQLQNTVD